METVDSGSQAAVDSIRSLLVFIGENINREGLKETPERIIKMWRETMRGYDESQRPKITTFKNGSDGIVYDQMVIDSGDYYSNCEHHFVPFFGKYFFGYIPAKNGRILGLSKVARVVDYHSAKLQIQERLTSEIVDTLWDALCQDGTEPTGMILVMEGEHLCKSMRGAKKKGKMRTAYYRGCFSEMVVRDEFLSMIQSM
jgi:GTP cyclohydrolase I